MTLNGRNVTNVTLAEINKFPMLKFVHFRIKSAQSIVFVSVE